MALKGYLPSIEVYLPTEVGVSDIFGLLNGKPIYAL